MKARVEVRHYGLWLWMQCTTRCTVLLSIDKLIRLQWTSSQVPVKLQYLLLIYSKENSDALLLASVPAAARSKRVGILRSRNYLAC